MSLSLSASCRAMLAALVLLSAPQLPAITIAPANPTVKEAARQQFTSSVPATWKVSCGSITSGGLYTANLYTSPCTVTATATNGSGSASTVVHIVSPIVMTPVSASTQQNLTQQFTASVPVTWSAKCGSITAGGLYTASAAVGSKCTIEGVATGTPHYTVWGGDTITAPATSGFAISPTSATVSEDGTQQFTASAAATWTASCGSITSGGLFTANLYASPCTVTATATSGGATASAVVTTVSPIVMTPVTAITPQNQTQQFTASMPVTWSAKCGSITSGGLFTASAAVGSKCTIEGIATSSPHYTVWGGDTIVAASSFTVSPSSVSVNVGATQQFTASAAATWATSCGSISSSGLFTAPSTTGTCTITATNSSGTKATATATVTSAQLSVTPSSVALHAIANQQFSANFAATWSTSCGAISSAGLFTAPATAGTCTITATSVSDPTQSATAAATISLVNYTMWKNGVSGTGVQPNELLLTPANVSSGTFGLSWSATVDAGIWSQPLYLNAVSIAGVLHNLLFVTTSNDSVYAFDADTGAQIWQRTFLSTGVTAVSGSSAGISTQTGILGTPVIDPVGLTLYVVAETSENNATYFPHRLHALDVTTGNDTLGGPVLISDPALPPLLKFQRPALLLANGNVYVGFGSIEDRTPYHGLLFAFDQTTLAQKAVFNVTPTGSEGGIWMSAAAPSADSAGDIYIATGNGTSDGINNFGESVVKLSPQLQPLDYFTPFDYQTLNQNDLDLGSGNVLVVPDQTGPYPHELIACGKPTPIYLLNRDALGGRGTTSDNVLQRLDHQVGGTGSFRDSGQPCYNSPAMWQQNVYFVANHDVMKMFTLSASTGLLSATPVSQGAFTYNWPGADPAISSNGNANGIVWTLDVSTGTLRANDATDVSKVLFVSPNLGTAIRWSPPTVANGHVYVGLSGKVVSYTLSAP